MFLSHSISLADGHLERQGWQRRRHHRIAGIRRYEMELNRRVLVARALKLFSVDTIAPR